MVTITAYEAAWRALEPGMTQQQFRQLIHPAYSQLCFPGEVSVRARFPHVSASPQAVLLTA
jgi:hypothetical protein